jgi:Zn-finger protein
MSSLYRGPSTDASYQVSIQLAKQFQRRRIFKNRPIRKKNCVWQPCLLTDQDEMNNLYRGHSIDASYQVAIHLTKRLQRRRIFFNRPIRNKNCLWWPCLLTDQDEVNNLFRGPTKDASYQDLVHLAKQFQRRIFLNRPIRNKNCLWWPCLLTDQDEMSNLYRGHSIDAP